MIASPARAVRRGLAIAVLTAGPAFSQTLPAPAVPTIPAVPAVGLTETAPAPDTAAPVAEPGPLMLIPQELPAAVPDLPVEESGEGIAVRSLQSIDPESIGVLDAGTGGFPVDMWTGTPRERIDALMARLPTAAPSEAQRTLTRRLLLSRAAIPLRTGKTQVAATDTAAPGVEPAATAPSLLDLRLNALFEMGLLDDLDALVQAAPSRADDASVQRLLFDSRLMRNDLPAACAITAVPPSDGLYWLKAGTFCKALAGDTAGADFGATLIEETVGEDSTVFLNLLQHITVKSGPEITSLAPVSALKVAMLRTANLPWPAGLDREVGPQFRQFAALDPGRDATDRMLSAEDLVAAGRLPTARLLELYTDIGFDAETLASALTVAEETGGPLGRALLVQAAMAQENTVARAELLKAVFDLARIDGKTAVLSKVLAPVLSTITPQRELWWLARDAARAYFANGAVAEGQRWTAILRVASARNPEARNDAFGIWPLARISGDRSLDRVAPDMLSAWAEHQRASAPDDAVRRITLYYTLLEALGETVPDPAWETLLLDAEPEFQRVPNAALTRTILRSAQALRQGETVLLALVMLGDAGPSQATPATLTAVLQSMAAVGLPGDARALAVDTVLGAGL